MWVGNEKVGEETKCYPKKNKNVCKISSTHLRIEVHAHTQQKNQISTIENSKANSELIDEIDCSTFQTFEIFKWIKKKEHEYNKMARMNNVEMANSYEFAINSTKPIQLFNFC